MFGTKEEQFEEKTSRMNGKVVTELHSIVCSHVPQNHDDDAVVAFMRALPNAYFPPMA